MIGGWASPGALARRGVLGINRRNAEIIQRYNPRHLYPTVDDKLRTKLLAVGAGLRVPELYEVVRYQHEVRGFHERMAGRPDFVVKPSRGSGGKGVLVVIGRGGQDYLRAGGQPCTRRQLERHLYDTLSGSHSLGGLPDKVLVERRIEIDPCLEPYSFQGVPDIRIVVFLGYPVMAMLRLSTSTSGGRANLHQGAVGVGLELATGRPLQAVQRNKVIAAHPDTQAPFAAIRIPGWRELLVLAARCCEVTGMGYLGIDLVIDRRAGPMILEMNARPGLSIQLANGAGLLPRLRRIEAMERRHASAAERVEFVCQQDWFNAGSADSNTSTAGRA